MTRAETTKFLGQLLIGQYFSKFGNHWASEVSVDPWSAKGKRVDFMQFSPGDQMSISGIEKGIFTCYEVKSCKEDVYSGNGLNFLGEKKLYCNNNGVLQRHFARFKRQQVSQAFARVFPRIFQLFRHNGCYTGMAKSNRGV